MRLARLLPAVIAVVLVAPALAQDETVVGPDARLKLDVTVYRDGFAHVRDVRTATLPEGPARIAFAGVSDALQPETAAVAAPGDAAQVLEQAYEAALLSQQALLRAHVGKTIEVLTVNPATGEESAVAAEVLAAEPEPILRIDGRVEPWNSGRLSFPGVPPGLRARPTLVATLEGTPGDHALALDYLTGGVGWSADYVVRAPGAGGLIELTLRATVRNDTDAAFDGATLAVIAGQVNRAAGGPVPLPRAAMAMAEAADVAPEPVGGAYRFQVPRRVDLPARTAKQVTLMTAARVPFVTRYRLTGSPWAMRQGAEPRPVQIDRRLEFVNDEASGLGTPLPAGVVRVYDRSAFIGEMAIADVAPGQKVTVETGPAFSLTATRRVTDYRQEGPEGEIVESAHEIVFENGYRSMLTVEVIEEIGGEWRILEEERPHKRLDAFRARWTVAVPGNGTATHTYRVRVERR